MNKLYKYLDKNEINYRRETFGSRYFDNVHYIFEGVIISMDYRHSATREKLLKYCRRYGYKIMYESRIFPDFSIHYSIATATDAENAANYYYYQDKSVSEWEQMQHREYSNGNYDINEQGKAIMQKWESLYLQTLSEQEERTA
jgi:hypothetical protein